MRLRDANRGIPLFGGPFFKEGRHVDAFVFVRRQCVSQERDCIVDLQNKTRDVISFPFERFRLAEACCRSWVGLALRCVDGVLNGRDGCRWWWLWHNGDCCDTGHKIRNDLCRLQACALGFLNGCRQRVELIQQIAEIIPGGTLSGGLLKRGRIGLI